MKYLGESDLLHANLNLELCCCFYYFIGAYLIFSFVVFLFCSFTLFCVSNMKFLASILVSIKWHITVFVLLFSCSSFTLFSLSFVHN